MKNPIDQEDEGGSFESYFRDASHAAESALAWSLSQRVDALDALRGLFSGGRNIVQLRIWCFMELASAPQGRIARDDLYRIFYALQPQALDSVIKRLRETGLIIWDQTSQDYSLSGLAQQLHGLLVPLTKSVSDDDELASLLAQVAGAHALGLTDAGHLKHLHAQLSRLALLTSLIEWRRAQMNGTRRDFALFAGEHTKSIGASDWKWLERFFDLERLGVTHFLPSIWLAGDVQLLRDEHVVDLAAVRCLAIPIEDVLRVTAIRKNLDHWWLIENRASFERQSGKRPAGTLMAWLPGRPSQDWIKAIGHLLQLSPAPLMVSADADPAGIDIALTVGAIWRSQGKTWAPYRMGDVEWQAVSQKWPLNDHDVGLLQRLLSDTNLPEQLAELCRAMLIEGRKAEQEGWL